MRDCIRPSEVIFVPWVLGVGLALAIMAIYEMLEFRLILGVGRDEAC